MTNLIAMTQRNALEMFHKRISLLKNLIDQGKSISCVIKELVHNTEYSEHVASLGHNGISKIGDDPQISTQDSGVHFDISLLLEEADTFSRSAEYPYNANLVSQFLDGLTLSGTKDGDCAGESIVKC